MKTRPYKTYSADKARQGEVILRKPWQRAVFLGGLAVCILLMIVYFIIYP